MNRYTKLDAQLQPLPEDTPLDRVTAIRVQSAVLDIVVGKSLPKRLTHQEAQAAVAKVELAGSPCRLPTIHEELAILHFDQINPAADPTFFGDMPTGAHWTSSAVPGYPDYFRVVSFNNGLVGYSHQDYDAFVRPVRVASLPAGQ